MSQIKVVEVELLKKQLSVNIDHIKTMLPLLDNPKSSGYHYYKGMLDAFIGLTKWLSEAK